MNLMALLENLLRLTMVSQKQEQFKVSSSSGDYDVVISNNEELLISNLNECKFFIADSFFKESFIFENIDKNNIFFVDASEDSKTLSFAEQIIHQMTLIKLKKIFQVQDIFLIVFLRVKERTLKMVK